MGLSSVHTSPPPPRLLVREPERTKALRGLGLRGGGVSSGSVVFTEDGSYCRAVPSSVTTAGRAVMPERAAGDIVTFSRSSRRRLLRMFSLLETAAAGWFVTLTFADNYGGENWNYKQCLDALGKRMLRRWPHCAFVWRVEFVERKSGARAGLVLPHFHLVVFNVAWSMADKNWLSGVWADIVAKQAFKDGGWPTDKEYFDHQKAGTSVEKVRSRRGLFSYVGKYIAKRDNGAAAAAAGYTGRVWGVIGRKNMPYSVLIEVEVSDGDYFRFIRVCRGVLKAAQRTARREKRRRGESEDGGFRYGGARFDNGVTIFLPSADVARWLSVAGYSDFKIFQYGSTAWAERAKV